MAFLYEEGYTEDVDIRKNTDLHPTFGSVFFACIPFGDYTCRFKPFGDLQSLGTPVFTTFLKNFWRLWKQISEERMFF